MSKPSRYIIFIVILGIIVAGFWTYKKIGGGKGQDIILDVTKRDIKETVKVRGEVVAEKEVNLSFPVAGVVEKIYVKEGNQVAISDPLIKLDTADYEFQVGQVNASIAESEAELEKAKTGATPEELNILQVKLDNAKANLSDAKGSVLDKLQDAYTKTDDAIRGKADQIFSNSRTSAVSLSFSSDLKVELESARIALETNLITWDSSLEKLSLDSDLSSFILSAKSNLYKARSFLDNAAAAVNAAQSGSNIASATLTVWKTDLSTARTNVNTAITNLVTAEEKLATANSVVSLAAAELDNEKAGSRKEDIKIAEANLDSYKNQLGVLQDKIKKSTIYAPVSGKVTKVSLEKGEVFTLGTTAVVLSSNSYKIQADISELEIGKIKNEGGNAVTLKFDAFPDKEFIGKVFSVEPQQIVKDGDIYYRTNVTFDGQDVAASGIRPGMSADLDIFIVQKNDVLAIPESSFSKKEDGQAKVTLIDSKGNKTDTVVTLGISDGEYVEVLSGLSLGQKITISEN
ncbi:MAG: HlyD family efflux transporter periplasmic adaptor subunit [Candidatus Paceibacterota bacterium]|jgi:RND family efflux transporter MFP subunit